MKNKKLSLLIGSILMYVIATVLCFYYFDYKLFLVIFFYMWHQALSHNSDKY